jgi:hypothetical protein
VTDIVLVLYKTPKMDVYVSVLNYIAIVSVCLCLLVYRLWWVFLCIAFCHFD